VGCGEGCDVGCGEGCDVGCGECCGECCGEYCGECCGECRGECCDVGCGEGCDVGCGECRGECCGVGCGECRGECCDVGCGGTVAAHAPVRVFEGGSMTEKKRVLLIDMGSLSHATWHMSSGEPDPNWTSDRIVSRVHELAAGNPHVAVCCDSGSSWRKDIDPTYKANRPEKQATFFHQVDLAVSRLKADGFPVWGVKGYEADDLIGTAAVQAQDHGCEVVIATADKDLLQLVGPSCTVKSTMTGDMIDADGVAVKLGVTPAQVRDYLCLVGDASDNVKGADKVGPKTAVKLLAQYGTLHNLLANLPTDTFTPGLRKALEDFAPRVETVQTLISLRYDAPINIGELLTERAQPQLLPLDDEPEETEAQTMETTEAVAPVTALAPLHPNVIEGEVIPFEMTFEPRNVAEAKELAGIIFESKRFSGYGSAPAVFAAIVAGRELGLQATAALRSMHIVEGKPTMSADLMRALVLKSGKAQYFRCIESTNEIATFATKRSDDPDSPEVKASFTIDDAQRAGLVKPRGGWEKYPAAMCVSRASAKLARLVYPDVLSGFYTEDEIKGQ
jgi:5'-3' exonuclease